MIHKPHDGLYRRVFDDMTNLASLLQVILPWIITRRIDWPTLERVPGEFISRELQRLLPDTVCRARLIEDPDTWVYFTIEHQARNDRWMALRFLGYMYFLWDTHINRFPEATSLPMVIPVALHQGTGKRRWRAPTELSELINFGRTVDAEFRHEIKAHLPLLRFILDDIAQTDPAELLARP